MNFLDLKINAPTLVQFWSYIGNNPPAEIIRLDDTTYVYFDEKEYYIFKSTYDNFAWKNWSIVDFPTDEDTKECGVTPAYYSRSLCLEVLSNFYNEATCLLNASVNCTCDFVAQILPYGCKCGGK